MKHDRRKGGRPPKHIIAGGSPWAEVCAIAARGRRAASYWAERRLNEHRWAKETADQQRCLRMCNGGLAWPEPPGVHDTDNAAPLRGGWKITKKRKPRGKRIN